MTPAQAAVLRRQIAERWPEVTDLVVEAVEGGAAITMTIDGRLQIMRVSPDGPLLAYLLARPGTRA